MRKNDIALLVLIISITLVASFFIVKAIFGEPKNSATEVEKVDPIATEVAAPSPSVFNKDAINPTVVIQIGDPSNQQPFGRQ